jgi:hypothetical protein
MEMGNIKGEKRVLKIDKFIIEYTIVDDLPNLDNDPCFKQQLEDAKAFLAKHPIPGVTMYNASDLKKK